MERKTVVMVLWRSTGRMEAYSSLTGFCAAHPQYAPHRIYARWNNGIYVDFRIELRRVPFRHNPYKTRRDGLKRTRPGPRRTRTKER